MAHSTTTLQSLFLFFVNRLILFQLFIQPNTIKCSIPEQIHISLGANQSEMIITWSTLQPTTDQALVFVYGVSENQLTHITVAEVSLFAPINLYVYRALLSNLQPLTEYYYRVGSNANWSRIYKFRTISDSASWLPSLAVFGDLGYQNAVSLPFLKRAVDEDTVDAIFHIGDIGYDLDLLEGKQGNLFMNAVESVAARVPYVTCPGNHERRDNFSHYDARFSMLADRYNPSPPPDAAPLTGRLNNHYHSLDLGVAHIILFSTEFYYYPQYGWEQIKYQFEWLERDLTRANQNRQQRPWIIVMGHRPMYCFHTSDTSCSVFTHERSALRQGIHMYGDTSSKRMYGLEGLFYKQGVDLLLFGHEHYYIRMKPMYKHKSRATNETNAFVDPKGPVHLTTGNAGNIELQSQFNPLIRFQPWVAAYHYDFGYTRIRFLDRLHLVVEQTSAEKGGVVIDQMEIKKSTALPNWLR